MRLTIFLVLTGVVFGQTARTKEPAVTPVQGESWINHLNRPFNQTAMGKTGRLGPPPPVPRTKAPPLPTLTAGYGSQTKLLHGSDLYRLNCYGCHRENGLGAPPEINSVINPVRSTSTAVIMEQMKERGKRLGMEMNISRADADALAKQSHDAIIQRLHKGGQDMPPFPQLSEAEIRTLEAYLRALAAVPGAEKAQRTVPETPARVGELIVKATCHICHSATGQNPTPEQLIAGAIPPLSALTNRTSMQDFVRKVTRGATITMGRDPAPYRGRMPVFDYLSEEEAADAYLYLTLYPPHH